MKVSAPVLPMPSMSYDSGEVFMATKRDLSHAIVKRREREFAIVEFGKEVSYDGHCGICDRDVKFSCAWDIHRTLPDGRKEPVWRERLVCPCGLSNRLRASFHFMLDRCQLLPDSKVYLTEQLTPFFDMAKGYLTNVTGSEFLRDGTAPGQVNANGIRHEDITALTFADETFDMVGTFEVMEHVPDYHAGLREMARVLKPGGHLIATFPFRPDLIETLVRAKIGADGEIEHLTEPEYHGDPLSAQGVLCFYHFGWDILDAMRAAGFREARCHFYWDWDSGYLGGAMPMFHAIK